MKLEQLWNRQVALVLLGMLTAAAIIARSRGLGPVSLWTDDAWVALAIKQPWSNVLDTSLTAIGFRAMVRVILEMFGTETPIAQALPFLLGVLTIPLTYAASRLLDLPRPYALFAAGMIASSDSLVKYTIYVKQYTGDAVCTLLLIIAVLYLLRQSVTWRRYILFSLLCSLSVVFSGQLLMSVAPAYAFLVLYLWHTNRHSLRIVFPLAVLTGIFCLGWYTFIIRPAIDSNLINFWDNKFIILNEGLLVALKTFGLRIGYIYNEAFNNTAVHISGGILLTLLSLTLKPRISFIVLAPAFIAILLAMAGKAPIGTRTDAYFIPVIAIAMAIGLMAWMEICASGQKTRIKQTGTVAGVVLAVSLLLWDLPESFVPEYRQEDVRTLTAIWDMRKQPSDHTVVYCRAIYAFSLYTKEPLVAEPGSYGRMANDNITLLPWETRNKPDRYAFYLREKISGTPERIWLIMAKQSSSDIPSLKKLIRDKGYRFDTRWETGGDAEMELYTRL